MTSKEQIIRAPSSPLLFRGRPLDALRVLLDTSSLMDPAFISFFANALMALVVDGRPKVVVPARVLEELRRHQHGVDQLRHDAARRALAWLDATRARGWITVLGEKDDPFAGSLFQAVITRYHTRFDFCLVSQDRALAGDVLRIATARSVATSHRLAAFRVARDGGVDRWRLTPENEAVHGNPLTSGV